MLFKIARKTIGCLFSLFVMASLFLIGVVWATLIYLPTLLEDKIEDHTGFKAEFEDLDVNVFRGTVGLTGAVIENPETFPVPTFIRIRQIKVDIKPMSLIREKVILEELIIDVEEFGYITTAEKENNAIRFINALRGSVGDLGEEEEAVEERQFLIEHFELRLKRVEYADFSRRNPRVRRFEPEIMIELEEVTDLKEIVGPLSRELSQIGLAILVNSFMKSLVEIETYRDLAEGILKIPSVTLEGGAKKIKQGAEGTGKVIKGVLDSLKKK